MPPFVEESGGPPLEEILATCPLSSLVSQLAVSSEKLASLLEVRQDRLRDRRVPLRPDAAMDASCPLVVAPPPLQAEDTTPESMEL